LAKAADDERTGQSDAPPDRYCALFGALPRQPTVRVRSWSTVGGFVLLGTEQSGAPLTSAWYCAALFLLLESTVGAGSRCSAGTPDGPVIFSSGRP
jgi:hypothetical protein